MRKLIYTLYITLFTLLCACAQYVTPPREQWPQYLRGVSLGDMTAEAIVAKRPVYLGAGGQMLVTAQSAENKLGDVNAITIEYMANLENELYDALRKPGLSVQRAGTDVVVLLVRDALMWLDAPDISDTGADTLDTIAKILKKYNATFIEIAGYTDSIRAQNHARALSLDMAQRTAIFFGRHDINKARMFVVGRGSSRPIAPQDDIGRLTNRRVEIRIAPAR